MIRDDTGVIEHRYDTKENWRLANPVLARGEIGIEIERGIARIKVGDGENLWSNLEYVSMENTMVEERLTLLENNKADNNYLSMPSNTCVQINITASGQTYIAPADGYIYTESVSTAGGAWMLLVVDNVYAETASNLGMEASVLTNVPVRKGAVVKFTYAMNHNIFFVPALSST